MGLTCIMIKLQYNRRLFNKSKQDPKYSQTEYLK